MKTERFKMFKLAGESLDAANRYVKLLQTEKRPFSKETINVLGEIGKIFGVQSPVVVIDHYHEGLPRAYRVVPRIYSHPHKENTYFMLSPIGYKEDVFTPEGGILATDKELQAFAHAEPESFLYPNKERGCSLPEDYNPETSIHRFLNRGIVQPDQKYIFFESADPNELRAEDNGGLTKIFDRNGRFLSPESLAYGPKKLLPIIRRLTCGATLAYPCDNPDEETFCPSGFKRLSPQEYQWFAADSFDLECGFEVPPYPVRQMQAYSLERREP